MISLDPIREEELLALNRSDVKIADCVVIGISLEAHWR
jgi:hypothetical protein